MPQERMTAKQFRALNQKSKGSKRVKHDYKADFLMQLAYARLPLPESEVYFAKPRRWRFDWAYKKQMIAIEYEGGIYFKSNEEGKGHQTVGNFEKDCRKYTEAALRGWKLIRITAKMVETGEALAFVERALRLDGSGNR